MYISSTKSFGVMYLAFLFKITIEPNSRDELLTGTFSAAPAFSGQAYVPCNSHISHHFFRC
jgi:hypothetical protein